VSTASAAAITLLVLALAGALPVLALIGPRLVAFPLFPLAGAVLAAAAAGCSIILVGTLLQWFVVWAVVGALAAGAELLRRPDKARALGDRLRHRVEPPFLIGGAVIVATAAWTLRPLRVPAVGFDTRAIWLLHARWLLQGHRFEYAAIRNPFLVVSHPAYPPLVSAVMALAWRLTGTSSDRIAVVMVALLNACALAVAAWSLLEAGRLGAVGLGLAGARRRILLGVAVVAAGLLTLLTGGLNGIFGTNGYADPLWSLGAVAVVMYGLVLTPTRSNLGVVALMAAVAGLTKVEGIAVAMLLLLVVATRLFLRRTATGGSRRPPVIAAVGGVVALAVWPLTTLIVGVPRDPSLSGSRDGSLANRAHHTLSAMEPHLHVVLLAVICGLLGLLVKPVRQRIGLGNDLWAWAALVGALIVLGGAYVFGAGDVELWLATSVNRTTIFVALLAWWIVSGWAVCGSARAPCAWRRLSWWPAR
jgi:hypothetical protein